MTDTLRAIWQRLFGSRSAPATAVAPADDARLQITLPEQDPLHDYLIQQAQPVLLDTLQFDSPALQTLRASGVALVVPLVNQGELVGTINLGTRRSEQVYSAEDRRLLSDLATQAAPAVRVAQLVREQQAEAAERSRIEQELQVARLIQQTLLPQTTPQPDGWQIAAHYHPAREVGGDFYDFFEFPDGRIGIFIGDVTDKGVPAALVMATTRTLLRSVAEQLITPGDVLERVNQLLHPDIPPRMFVTCCYLLLDPTTGHLQFANAGHDLPHHRHRLGVEKLEATGMPLGLMPAMQYAEKSARLAPGDTVLLHSDGLVEAHNAHNEMFGYPRLHTAVGHADNNALIEQLMSQWHTFTNGNPTSQDDVTLVQLHFKKQRRWQFDSVSESERRSVAAIAPFARAAGLSEKRLARLQTAVGETVLNAIEHGNRHDPHKAVTLTASAESDHLHITVEDAAADTTPLPQPDQPDLAAKLRGEQSARGWGLFLAEKMVDTLKMTRSAEGHHRVEMWINLEESQ